MDKCGYDGLPVVRHEESDRQIGLVWRKDIDSAYRRAIEYHEMTSDLADKISMANIEKDVRFIEGYIITEIPVPKIFIGKTIKKLNIGANFGVRIVTIKSAIEKEKPLKIIPQAIHRFSSDDLLIIAGKAENINKLKQI
jgi:trk system potassium uptake protein